MKRQRMPRQPTDHNLPSGRRVEDLDADERLMWRGLGLLVTTNADSAPTLNTYMNLTFSAFDPNGYDFNRLDFICHWVYKGAKPKVVARRVGSIPQDIAGLTPLEVVAKLKAALTPSAEG